MGVLRTKSVAQSIADTDEPEFRIKKSLSALDLTVFGIGVVIGAGIFTLTGRAAHEVAGPAIVISFAGAALVFFAYIGFDVVATTAEETRNPQRDLPIGIIASLVICTLLYCAVALVVTGMVPYQDLDPAAARANAFAFHGQTWMATLISAGAVAGLTTVVLTLLIGATRIIFAMSRDALPPVRLAKVHARCRTPWVISLLVTVVVAVVAGFTPVGLLEEMVNIGTLSAFVLVSVGVIVLRRRRRGVRTAARGLAPAGGRRRRSATGSRMRRTVGPAGFEPTTSTV